LAPKPKFLFFVFLPDTYCAIILSVHPVNEYTSKQHMIAMLKVEAVFS